jgi:dihydrofolate reductase
MNAKRKVILYIAVSLDGYIARSNGDIDWLSIVNKLGEDYGYNEFIKTVDTVIMGRKTYDKVLSMGQEFPHKDRECYIMTREERQPEGPPSHAVKTIFYHGKVTELISQLKSREGKNIFIDGGAELVNALMKDDLIDEYIISVIPVFLGNGIRLFKDYRPEMKLQLVSSKSYDTGLVQMHYVRIEL